MSQEKNGYIKPFIMDLTKTEHERLKKNASIRNMEQNDYVRYLIRNDNPEMYTDDAAAALRMISTAAAQLEEDENNKELINEIQEGVFTLWQCL